MKSTTRSLFLQLLRIEPEETKQTFLSFVYLFTSVGAFIISRITRDVLFLELPNYKEQLPLTYVAVAATVSTIMLIYSKHERRFRRDQTNLATLILLTIVTLIFRYALEYQEPWVYVSFYIWVEIFGAFLIVQFWSFTSEIYHTRQAKRLFAIIGGGGVLANIVFGLIVRGYVKTIGTQNLLFVIVFCLLVSAWATRQLSKVARTELINAYHRHPKKSQGSTEPSTKPLQTKHVKLLAAMIALTYMVSTFVDYQFKVIIGDSISQMDERTAYLGNFFLYTGIIAALIQFTTTSRLLERFGVLPALLLLPFALFLGSSVLQLSLGFTLLWLATAIKGAENVLRYTITDSTVQLLYIPLPAHVRGRAKAVIDGTVKHTAIALTGLCLAFLVGSLQKFTLLSGGPQLSAHQLGGITCGLTILWAIVIVFLKQEYVASLMKTLKRRRLNFGTGSMPIADESAIRVLHKALASDTLGEVFHALELLPALQPKTQKALQACVYNLFTHRSPEIRSAAINYLNNRLKITNDYLVPLLEDPNPQVRCAALQAYSHTGGSAVLEDIKSYLSDSDKYVRAHAVVALMKDCGLDGVLEAAPELKKMLSSPSQKTRSLAAWVLGEINVQQFYQPLKKLLQDPSEKVQTQALIAVGKLNATELLTNTLPCLENPRLRSTTVRALINMGESIETELFEILENLTNPPSIRAGIVQILEKGASHTAIEMIEDHLPDPETIVRVAAVRSLLNLKRQFPSRQISSEILAHSISHEAKLWYRFETWKKTLKNTPEAELLINSFEDRQKNNQEHISQLLALHYSYETMEIISRNLRTEHTATYSNALELLDNLLNKSEKEILMPIFDNKTPENEKLGVAASKYGLLSPPLNEVLLTLLKGEDNWLASCATYSIGQMRQENHAQEIVALLDRQSEICQETAIWYLQELNMTDQAQERIQELTCANSAIVCSRATIAIEEYAKSN
ncbi:MAG: Npt1/Npt2 family nucleotide transporter [Myxococcota bacterium]|nr:Npt1/Npt2 family nucleotide transporter [Myxococcota bacterium]